jgi:hypothetical protein
MNCTHSGGPLGARCSGPSSAASFQSMRLRRDRVITAQRHWSFASSTAVMSRPLHQFLHPPLLFLQNARRDVADAVKLASEYQVPVIPFGVGSS